MFIELEFNISTFTDNFDDNFGDIIESSIDALCSDSMLILQNNSKVLRFLTDETSLDELGMLVESLTFAIKHGRFELLQNIILGMKGEIHKLAALEIKYFDDKNKLLRSDIYKTFMTENFKKHAFIAPALKEIFDILNETSILSPTNAAFALKCAFETGEQNFIENVLLEHVFSKEFVRQMNKRYCANFGMDVVDEIKNQQKKLVRNDAISKYFKSAV